MDHTSKTFLLELYDKIKIFNPDEVTDEQAINIIIQALFDKAPVVVCKALRIINSLITSNQFVEELVQVARQLMDKINELEHEPEPQRVEADAPAGSQDMETETPVEAHRNVESQPRNENVTANRGTVQNDDDTQKPLTSNPLMNFLLARCDDEKVNPRKWAITAVETLYLHYTDSEMLDACMHMFQARCRDLSLSIRKQAAESLTRLLRSCAGVEKIENTWLNSVMYLIVDRELAVQQFCAKLISDVILQPIVQNIATDVTWRLLSKIERETSLKRLMVRCLVFQHREHNLPQRIVKTLEGKTQDGAYANAAWMLLSELSAFLDISPSSAAKYWQSDKMHLDSPDRIVYYISKILANKAKSLKDDERDRLQENMADALTNYKINNLHISAVYYAYARICDGIQEASLDQGSLALFNRNIFANCIQHLDALLYDTAPPTGMGMHTLENTNISLDLREKVTSVRLSFNHKCDKLVRIITSIGECVQYTPSLINKQIFKLLKVIMASDVIKGIEQSVANTPGISPNTSFHGRLPDSQSQTLGQTFGQTLGQTFGQTFGQTMADDPLRNSNFFVTKIENRVLRVELLTRTVRAHAVLTLGKLCLQDEKLAKKCVPVFVRQLKANKDHFVRNNIVVAICDLCIRYTLLVDRYSAILASCLRDSSVLVRHQTLMLLTNLIKEQFLKWEGAIIYRFVTALLDPEKSIRVYAEFCLVDILLVQYPMMFSNHFLECLFYFNDIKHQLVLKEPDEYSDVRQKCSLEGSEKSGPRMHLYKFMLKTLADDKKFTVCQKISSDIFGSIVDGSLSLTESKVVNLLRDSFKILCSSSIKFALQVGKKNADDEGDDEEPPEAVKSMAKNFISSVYRKALVEAVMPHLIMLKDYLVENSYADIHTDCLEVIADLLKHYPEQMDDYLVSNPQLKAEIEFDLRNRNAVITVT
ncbi:non-SMC mitotic condensation complex subunit 1 domain-containing protein [Ditylenchus destructor]|nr:non-SMC mitotic condensation complex subunit 1 domain-containing protein [Ditylenchus destructor]